MVQYLWSIAISVNRMCSALLFGRPHNTISGVTGYYASRGKLVFKILRLFINYMFADETHCDRAVAFDRKHGGTFKD